MAETVDTNTPDAPEMMSPEGVVRLKMEENVRYKEAIRIEIEQYIIPFYERLQKRSGLSPLIFSLLVALPFLLIHRLLAEFEGVDIVEDFSFFVSFMIGVCLFLLLVATRKIKKFVVNLIELTDIKVEEYSTTFILILNRISSRKLLWPGLIFGIANPLIGWAFGYWYTNPWLNAWLVVQYALVGTCCGIAFAGIVVVFSLISELGKQERLNLSYFAPDHCSGTLIVGIILFNFAIYTLIMGILIAVYIYFSPWRHPEQHLFTRLLFIAWMTFPFLASVSVFVFPVLKLHRLLKDYKGREHERIRRQMEWIAEAITRLSPDESNYDKKVAYYRTHYDFLKHSDELIGHTNTWPYDIRYGLSYIATLVVPVLIAIVSRYVLRYI